ncbi:serine protease [Methylobacterium sp. Leaf117]|uniref:serine protease n=1 Tax=Methylobacterium sp. Leaf117 TaxID=1736260 RepID=UPI000AD8B8ED|nr:serine protease [Methylobacterium sp. Leaf117]
MMRRDPTIRDGTGWVMTLTAALASVQMALAQTPPAPAPARVKPSAPAPDPAFEAARTAFEALPEAERKGLQDALVWTGDYNSVVNGTFGRRSYEAFLAYAKRSGGTGLPDATGRAALLKEGAAARAAVRFVVKSDPVSGVVLGVPERILPKRTPQSGGTRWQSADWRITLETKSYPAGETGLEAVFARITAPSADRRITYKLLRPDFLVVTAETGTGRSYIRYAAGEAGLRGFTLGYDKALSGEVDRLSIAIANSFVPFADAAPASAPAPAEAVVASPSPPPVLGSQRVPAATGLVVAPGRVLTSAAALEGCGAPMIAGLPTRPSPGGAADLMILETGPLPGRAALAPSVHTGAIADGEGLVALVVDAEGGVLVAPGHSGPGGGRISAPLQPGAGGAPVLDRAGTLTGLVATVPKQPRLIAGIMPPASYGLVRGDALATFLGAAGVRTEPAPKAAGTLGEAVAALAGAMVAITCQP